MTFTRKANLSRHIKSKNKKMGVQEGKSMCLECGYKCHRIVELRKHLSEEHGINFSTEVLNFNTVEAFKDWKMEYEESLNCQYIIKSGNLKNKMGENVTYWQCNRSGVYKCIRQVKRRTKSSGM